MDNPKVETLKSNIKYYQEHMRTMLVNHGFDFDQADHIVDLLTELIPWTRQTMLGMWIDANMPTTFDPKNHNNYLNADMLTFKDVGIKLVIP